MRCAPRILNSGGRFLGNFWVEGRRFRRLLRTFRLFGGCYLGLVTSRFLFPVLQKVGTERIDGGPRQVDADL